MLDKVDIRWIEETDSTQDEVRRHLSDYDNMSVVAARLQTAGRGQRGNKWHARGGENLTFSMLLRFVGNGFPPLDVSGNFRITKAATLAVVEYLGKKGIGSLIKWPNDIYVGDRKICGILIENMLWGRIIDESIVGIGLNVNQKAFLSDAPNPVSLIQLTGKDTDREALLQAFLKALPEALEMEPEALAEAYRRRLYRQDGFYAFMDGRGRFMAKVLDVLNDGRLVLLDAEGTARMYACKEVQFCF